MNTTVPAKPPTPKPHAPKVNHVGVPATTPARHHDRDIDDWAIPLCVLAAVIVAVIVAAAVYRSR